MLNAARNMAWVLMLTAGMALGGVYEDMLHAVNNDDEHTVAQLLKRGVDVNTVDANGDSLLALAARRGKLEMVKTLLDARPRVNSRNGRGETALMLAPCSSSNRTICRWPSRAAIISAVVPFSASPSTWAPRAIRMRAISMRLRAAA